ncbi:WXG100 family type VII secretion target [Mycolicibacterium brumae]|uniref:ESAT-6-like protein n=1 Tax=Mycolicibacterium brumae TaxID=85968 RepID=A0A2G5PHA4_9MYCO|nr:WXG100 family type VII secretion target [Mycolicibacterium brumae]MCV7194520.1 WXG100 family type VII secretion target [Mycolicibacterium brumae]PIB77681.1 WXG100 family type VII secretion target [Mycolicibacterium brumae]RWA20125.1 hypothetical protein MBRU_15955 [Mycolicibacterium brumae DSM 44177]UWW10055.1 ESX secretion-associated protein esxT [Mycolicibacterium brumae]
MDGEVINYQFGAIEDQVSWRIRTTSMRMNTELADLKTRIAPLRATWTRETAAAFGAEADRWDRAAGALNTILDRLYGAVTQGAAGVSTADRAEAGRWR